LTKIVCISDTHNFHRDVDVPDGDILIHAGDFTLTGSIGEVIEFNDWLGTLDHPYKIIVAGNHDRCLGESGILGLKIFTNGIYLERSGLDIDGIKFWGAPMTPAFNGMRGGLTFYTNSKNEAKRVWRGMPKKTDVLITHGPPFGILDEVIEYPYHDYKVIRHCGDGMLASKVIANKPKYHIFGHIHEGYGRFTADYGTKFINCSVVNEAYNLKNRPIVIDL
jgi:calcineurin-like phosphoesterase family protein